MVKKIMANLDGVSLVLAGRKDFESSLSTNVQKVYTIPGPNNKKFWSRKSWGRIDYIPRTWSPGRLKILRKLRVVFFCHFDRNGYGIGRNGYSVGRNGNHLTNGLKR